MIREPVSNAESYDRLEGQIRQANTDQRSTRSDGMPVKDLVVHILGYDVPEPQRVVERLDELIESLRTLNQRNLAAIAEVRGQSVYSFEAVPELETLADVQGVSPVQDTDELVADFWPEDESIDEFIDAVRRWRSEEDVADS
jgi:hypothetical protein